MADVIIYTKNNFFQSASSQIYKINITKKLHIR